MKFNYVKKLLSVVIASTFCLCMLTACDTIDQMTAQKREKQCVPGSECWNNLPEKAQQIKRSQWMRQDQAQQMLQQNSHSRLVSRTRKNNSEF